MMVHLFVCVYVCVCMYAFMYVREYNLFFFTLDIDLVKRYSIIIQSASKVVSVHAWRVYMCAEILSYRNISAKAEIFLK